MIAKFLLKRRKAKLDAMELRSHELLRIINMLDVLPSGRFEDELSELTKEMSVLLLKVRSTT